MCMYYEYRFNKGTTIADLVPYMPCKVVIDGNLVNGYCDGRAPRWKDGEDPPPPTYNQRYRRYHIFRVVSEVGFNVQLERSRENPEVLRLQHPEFLAKYKSDQAKAIAAFLDPDPSKTREERERHQEQQRHDDLQKRAWEQ